MKRLTNWLRPGFLVLLCALSPAVAQTSDPVREAQRLTRVAQTAYHEGRYDDAIRAYQTIVVIAKSVPKISAAAELNVGNINMKLHKYDQATTAFQRSLVLDSGSAEASNNLGEALGELKQYQRALEAFQQAVAIDATFVKARYNMGVTYDHLGQMKYAEFIYKILIRDHPDFALAYDSLAVTLSKSGRGREAIGLHQKAIALDPQDPSFYFNFAISYLILNDLRKAQEQQQRLHDLDPAMAEQLAAVIARRQR